MRQLGSGRVVGYSEVNALNLWHILLKLAVMGRRPRGILFFGRGCTVIHLDTLLRRTRFYRGVQKTPPLGRLE